MTKPLAYPDTDERRKYMREYMRRRREDPETRARINAQSAAYERAKYAQDLQALGLTGMRQGYHRSRFFADGDVFTSGHECKCCTAVRHMVELAIQTLSNDPKQAPCQPADASPVPRPVKISPQSGRSLGFVGEG